MCGGGGTHTPSEGQKQAVNGRELKTLSSLRGQGPRPFVYQRCFVQGPWFPQPEAVYDGVEAKTESSIVGELSAGSCVGPSNPDSSSGTEGLSIPD